MSRDIVFYVTIFPFAAVPKSSISDSNSLGSDTFVFPHCVSGSSYPFPPSHLVQPSFTTSAVPNTADTSNAGPAPSVLLIYLHLHLSLVVTLKLV